MIILIVQLLQVMYDGISDKIKSKKSLIIETVFGKEFGRRYIGKSQLEKTISPF